MDPGPSHPTSNNHLIPSGDSDLSRHAWIALAALAIAVPIQASIQYWYINRRKAAKIPIPKKLEKKQLRDSPTKHPNRPVLNTIDEEEDDLDMAHSNSSSSKEQQNGDANQDSDPTPKSKRSKERRKRGPNLLKERSSRARQRVASWTLAASSEHDKSTHAVTALEPPPDIASSSTSTLKNLNGNEQQRNRDASVASSSRTGTESLYGDLDEAASETASHLRFDVGPEQLSIIRAPSTSTSTSVSAGDYLDNSSIASASLSIPTSAPESSVTCASNLPDPSRTSPAPEQEATPPLDRANNGPKSFRSEIKHPFDNSTPPSPARGGRENPSDLSRGSPGLAHPRPLSNQNHNLDTRSITSSPSRNYSPAPAHEKPKESTTVLYDSSASNANQPVVSLTTQVLLVSHHTNFVSHKSLDLIPKGGTLSLTPTGRSFETAVHPTNG